VDGGKKCAHPASARARNRQARAVDLHGTQGLGAREECEEVDDVIEDFVAGAGREKSIVCRDECEACCDRAL
jgi:hypothetical protein